MPRLVAAGSGDSWHLSPALGQQVQLGGSIQALAFAVRRRKGNQLAVWIAESGNQEDPKQKCVSLSIYLASVCVVLTLRDLGSWLGGQLLVGLAVCHPASMVPQVCGHGLLHRHC